MFQIRKAADRGHANHGWLDTFHTFSFGEYHDPQQMGFRALRVINEDRVEPGKGFGTHGHRDMEIITLVLQGELEHKDSMGHGEILRPGEFQHMSAGRGIRHSEFNPSATEAVHLYQIWLLPSQTGIQPAYEQKRFDPQEQQGRLRLVASPDGAQESLPIQQDARIYLANLQQGQTVEHTFEPGRYGWLQVLRGSVTANGHNLDTSDGIAINNESRLTLTTGDKAEVMLFDLP
jgi:redox-sensitive bicupin YhaK (pirin superfamily)